MAKIGLYDIAASTIPESNKSQADLSLWSGRVSVKNNH